MSTYSLSGAGVQGLSNRVTAVHVNITTLPAGLTHGRANPTNNFDIALFRFGDGTGYGPPIPINGGPDWIGVPVGTTSLGYSVLNGAVLSVIEVIGGAGPVPVVHAVTSVDFMPKLLSPASKECIGIEMAGNATAFTSSTAWFANNLSVLIPLRITDTFICTNAWVISGSSAAGHWDVGIYDDSLALVAHTGSTLEVGTVSMQIAALSTTLQPGIYWLAISGDSTALTTAMFTVSTNVRTRSLGVRTATSNFPLATTPSLITPTINAIPVFGISTYSP